jgi:hypothetical protein
VSVRCGDVNPTQASRGNSCLRCASRCLGTRRCARAGRPGRTSAASA